MARPAARNQRKFSLTSITRAHRSVMRACGRLVLGHGAEESLWASQLERASTNEITLDLSCVSDVDARGLGVLADLARRAKQRGTSLSVVAASRTVARLVEMTGLRAALPGPWTERADSTC